MWSAHPSLHVLNRKTNQLCLSSGDNVHPFIGMTTLLYLRLFSIETYVTIVKMHVQYNNHTIMSILLIEGGNNVFANIPHKNNDDDKNNNDHE